MPELPEVETTRLGVINYVKDKRLLSINMSNKKLRYPFDFSNDTLVGLRCLNIERRAKYLIFNFGIKKLLVHLGMSGSLRVENASDKTKKKHDHVVLRFEGNHSLIYHDPRRFGFVVMYNEGWKEKMDKWGPEPLSKEFNKTNFYEKLKMSSRSIKQVLMDQKNVVGVGNIYANEVLFKVKLHPMTKASLVSKEVSEKMIIEIKNILKNSIEKGGTTLRDFVSGKENPGYFKQSLLVYGREGLPCTECGTMINRMVIAQRSSFYCPCCQPSSDNER